ncbi:unnamed protein product, partial [Closterium sp. NIES-65]
MAEPGELDWMEITRALTELTPLTGKKQGAGKQDAQGGVERQEEGKMKTVGKQTVGKQTVGKQTVGKQTVGKQTVGKQTVGKQTVGKQTVGKQTVGKQTVGKQTVGKQTVGKQTVGKQTVGKQTVGKQTGRGEAGRGEADRGEADRGEADRGEADRGEADRGEADRGEADCGEADRGEADRTLGGTVRLIFQPAEEGGAGGKRMVDGGALKGASAAFALHVSPKIPAGYVGSRPGMLLAGSGRFNATVWGKGGHAAMPQFAADPILAAAHIVS